MLPGARLTLVAVGLAFCLGFLGTALGALWLGSILGLPLTSTLVPQHPRLQLFGFLGIFISGVAYTLVPRFKNRRLPSPGLAYASLALLLLSNVAWLLAPLAPLRLEPLGNYSLLAGSAIFAALIASTLRKPSGVLAVAEPYIWLAGVSFPLTSLYILYKGGGDPFADDVALYLSLLGFPASMIYGVFIRTIHFRDPFRHVVLRRRTALLGFLLQLTAILLLLVSPYWGASAPILASAFFLGAGVALIMSIQGFRRLKDPAKLNKMLERDRTRYVYFSSLFVAALLWLLVALVLGCCYLLTRHLGLRDGFIHAMSLGFIGNTIMAYMPILLPPMLTARVPYKGLTRGPGLVLNIATLWRLLGYWATGLPALLSWMAWLSGPFLILAMAWFLYMAASLKT